MQNIDNSKAKAKLITLRVVSYIFLIFTAALCLFFFLVLLVNSSKSNADLTGVYKFEFGSDFFKNFDNVLNGKDKSGIDVKQGIINSFLVALLSSLLTTYFSALTAYGVYAYRFKGRKIVATFILAVMMIPSQVASVGFIQICFQYELTNKLWVLIVPSIAAPGVYFYMLQYLKATLPLDLVEASRMDGSNEFMTFNRIVLPIMKPALAVQMIFSFVASWNNYYLPSLLISDDKKKTLPVLLQNLRSKQQSSQDAGQVWMVILLSVLPVIIVYIILSKSIIKGVTSGSVKG